MRGGDHPLHRAPDEHGVALKLICDHEEGLEARDVTREARADDAASLIFDQITQEHIDYMLAKIPRGRFLLVEEIASMVTWLLSRENSFTTAGVFDISGGRATY